MDALSPEMSRLLSAKAQRRQRLAALPIAEKVRIIVRLQEMAAPLLRQQGKKVCVWTLDD